MKFKIFLRKKIGIKNILIFFLVFLAIYQTAYLWFESFSGYNLIYFLKNRHLFYNNENTLEHNVESVIINVGENKFLRQYENIYISEYKKTFDEAITETLSKGSYEYKEKFDLKEIASNKSILYIFDYDINSSDLDTVFGLDFKKVPKDIVYNTIALEAFIEDESYLKATIFHTEEDDAHVFILKKEDLAKSIYYIIENFSNFATKQDLSLLTISSGENTKSSFAPAFLEGEVFVNKIKATNPLEEDGGVLLSSLSKYVYIFFENYYSKFVPNIDDIYTYKDDNIVIKYYPNGVLEYVNYKTSSQTNESFYSLAIDFLAKDTNIKNEFYLTKYEKTEDGAIFYFDYKINNFPIVLSSELKEKTGMESMIEVTVAENEVQKYKRIVYEFEIDETLQNIDTSILNNIQQNSNLVYYFDEIYDLNSLALQINKKDEIYQNLEDSDNNELKIS